MTRAQAIGLATLVAGTLDIGSAIVLTLANGKSPARMLAGLASGPFGDRMLDLPVWGAILGLLVHFAIMSVMATVFVLAAERYPIIRQRTMAACVLYGLLIYFVMYWLVIPLRWSPSSWPPKIPDMALPIAIHIVLVGLPIAIITSWRSDRKGARTSAG